MEYLTVTELKDNMRVLMDKVANGESLIVTKKGKPVARIEPFDLETREKSWKLMKPRIKVKGITDSTPIIREMRDQQ